MKMNMKPMGLLPDEKLFGLIVLFELMSHSLCSSSENGCSGIGERFPLGEDGRQKVGRGMRLRALSFSGDFFSYERRRSHRSNRRWKLSRKQSGFRSKERLYVSSPRVSRHVYSQVTKRKSLPWNSTGHHHWWTRFCMTKQSFGLRTEANCPDRHRSKNVRHLVVLEGSHSVRIRICLQTCQEKKPEVRVMWHFDTWHRVVRNKGNHYE